MTKDSAGRDANFVAGLVATTQASPNRDPVVLWADPATHRLLTNTTVSGTVDVNIVSGGSGVAAYSDSGGVDRKGLVDADRHVQADVLTLPAISGTVAVSNMIAAVETGLAKDLTLTNSTQKTKITDGTDDLPIGPITNATGTTSSSGDTTVVSVSAGSKLKLYHLSFVPDPASSADVVVTIKVGTTAKYTWRCNKAGSGFARSIKSGQGWVEGADGEDLVINLNGAVTVTYNFEYDVVAV